MIELPDGKISRTLPEQVGFLSEQVQRIFRFLDGINVQDNVVVVDNIATPLTAEELVIVNRDVAFLVYSGQLYIKKSVSGSTAYFDVVFSISAGTTITFNSSEIQVNLSNGGMSLVSNSPVTYSKSQIDTLLSAKADITYVDAQLALKANLSGATFTGNVTMGSGTQLKAFENIVDKDGHLRFIEGVGIVSAITGFTSIYCRWSLSGSHLMLVLAGRVDNASVIDVNTMLCKFNLPDWVVNKIYPVVGNLLEYKNVVAISSSYSSQQMNTYINKFAAGLTINIASTFTATDDRTFRVVFDLLIDNE